MERGVRTQRRVRGREQAMRTEGWAEREGRCLVQRQLEQTESWVWRVALLSGCIHVLHLEVAADDSVSNC